MHTSIKAFVLLLVAQVALGHILISPPPPIPPTAGDYDDLIDAADPAEVLGARAHPREWTA